VEHLGLDHEQPVRSGEHDVRCVALQGVAPGGEVLVGVDRFGEPVLRQELDLERMGPLDLGRHSEQVKAALQVPKVLAGHDRWKDGGGVETLLAVERQNPGPI
jgi:hypothetical protein